MPSRWPRPPTDDEERRRWLTFALVGGGPTGVELAGQIRELATRNLHAEFRRIRPEDARVLLFDGGAAAAGRVRAGAGGQGGAGAERRWASSCTWAPG